MRIRDARRRVRGNMAVYREGDRQCWRVAEVLSQGPWGLLYDLLYILFDLRISYMPIEDELINV